MPQARVTPSQQVSELFHLEPFATGGPVTDVRVERDNSGHFTVTGAEATDIQLATPVDGDDVDAGFRATGTGTAFEATLNYRVFPIGGGRDLSTGDHIVMAGANGEVGPFDDTISFEPSGATVVAFVLYAADMSGQGEMSAATVVRLRVGSGVSPSAGDGMVAWTDSGDVVDVARDGTRSPARHSVATLVAPRLDRSGPVAFVEQRDFSDAGGSCGRLIAMVGPPDSGAVPTVVVAGSVPAVSPDARSLAYVGCDGTVRIRWHLDGSDGQPDEIVSGFTGAITSLDWAPDGAHLVLVQQFAARSEVWTVGVGTSDDPATQPYGIEAPGTVAGARFMPDGRILVAFDNTAADNGTAGFEIIGDNGDDPVSAAGDVRNGIKSIDVNRTGAVAYVDGDTVLWTYRIGAQPHRVGTGYLAVAW